MSVPVTCFIEHRTSCPMDHRYVSIAGANFRLFNPATVTTPASTMSRVTPAFLVALVKIREAWTLIRILQASPISSLRLWCSSLDELGDEKYRRVDTDPVWQYTEEKKRLYAHMIGKLTCCLPSCRRQYRHNASLFQHSLGNIIQYGCRETADTAK